MAQPIWASEILPPQHTPAKNRLVFPCVSALHASYWVIMVTPKIFFNNSLSLGVALRDWSHVSTMHNSSLHLAPPDMGPRIEVGFIKVITCYNPINYSCYSSAINPGFWSELNQLSRYCLEASPCSFSPWSSWSAPPYGLPKKTHGGWEMIATYGHLNWKIMFTKPWDMFKACPQIFRENPSNTRQFHGLKLDSPNILPTIFRRNNN